MWSGGGGGCGGGGGDGAWGCGQDCGLCGVVVVVVVAVVVVVVVVVSSAAVVRTAGQQIFPSGLCHTSDMTECETTDLPIWTVSYR